MKKYICSNCGFRNRFQVETMKHEKTGAKSHKCRNCNAVAFKSKGIIENIMRGYMMKHELNFTK